MHMLFFWLSNFTIILGHGTTEEVLKSQCTRTWFYVPLLPCSLLSISVAWPRPRSRPLVLRSTSFVSRSRPVPTSTMSIQISTSLPVIQFYSFNGPTFIPVFCCVSLAVGMLSVPFLAARFDHLALFRGTHDDDWPWLCSDSFCYMCSKTRHVEAPRADEARQTWSRPASSVSCFVYTLLTPAPFPLIAWNIGDGSHPTAHSPTESTCENMQSLLIDNIWFDSEIADSR